MTTTVIIAWFHHSSYVLNKLYDSNLSFSIALHASLGYAINATMLSENLVRRRGTIQVKVVVKKDA